MERPNSNGFISFAQELVIVLLVVFLIRTFLFGLYQVPTGSMETTMLVGERFLADKFSYLFRVPKRGDIITFNAPDYAYSENKLLRLFQEYVWGPANWTKRIIGVPGDKIEGKIENGKPVIYLNDKKLSEPYVNQHPLIGVWKEDLTKMKKEIDGIAKQLTTLDNVKPNQMKNVKEQLRQNYAIFKSFHPEYSYDDQPFYRVSEDRIIKNNSGENLFKYPQKPISELIPDASISEGKNSWNGSDQFKIELSDHEYWVMGDNRRASHDSRFFGPLTGELIHGKILLRIWSIDSYEGWWILDFLRAPLDFFKRLRWNRFFTWVT